MVLLLSLRLTLPIILTSWFLTLSAWLRDLSLMKFSQHQSRDLLLKMYSLYALRRVQWSESSVANCAFASSASFACSFGRMKTLGTLRHATILRISLEQLKSGLTRRSLAI